MTPFYRTAKFWLAVVSALLIIANEGLGMNIPTDVVMAFAALIISYILGDSVVTAVGIIKDGRIEVARMNNTASLEYAKVMCTVAGNPDLARASKEYANIESKADRDL